MKNHFNLKSLWFYGTMIGGVAILFRIVSGYGEAYLKAPPNIGGFYLSEQSLPGCPESTRFTLMIQQSGIYLHGAMRLVEREETARSPSSEEDLPLSGLWDQQQLSLSGSALLPVTCLGDAATANSQKLRQTPVAVQGKVSTAETAEFTGKVTLAESNPLDFTAVRAASAAQSRDGH